MSEEIKQMIRERAAGWPNNRLHQAYGLALAYMDGDRGHGVTVTALDQDAAVAKALAEIAPIAEAEGEGKP